jgi:thiamine-monophosphate kinase
MPLSEFGLIEKVFAPLAKSKAALALRDDVALLPPRPGQEQVITTDALIEGVDFFPDDPPGTIARKALRVNLSDLAAKGAKPAGYLLTLALPKTVDTRWLKIFARGLAADQKFFGITLLGGDLSGTPGPLTVSITAFGYVPKGRAILRSGARAGDLVFVTGTIGDSGGGLDALKTGRRAPKLVARYRVPEPRVAFGRKLRGLASAALDVSDGLIADLGHLADVSKVHIAVDAARVPLSPDLRRAWGRDAVLRAVAAGDDYEIAFTAPASRRAAIHRAAAATKTQVTEIGFVMKGRGVALLGADGKPIQLAKKGWQHF